MNWKPTWRRVSFWLRIIIGVAGSLIAASASGQLTLPQPVVLWLGIIVIAGPGVLSEISKLTVEEANVKINEALYTPSPLDRISVPEPPEEAH
jgi:hypothetical protein